MVTKCLGILFVFSLFICDLHAMDAVVADGTAMIEGDLGKAKTDALNNAYESAIRTTIAGMYSEEIVKANDLKLSKLYKKAASFITSSKIIYQKQNEGVDSTDVRVQVTVDVPAIKEYLAENGVSLNEEKISTILPLIVERTSPEGEGQYWWGDASRGGFVTKRSFSDIEKALSKYFAQRNFSLIDPYSNELSSNVPESYRYMELKSPEITKLGHVFNTGLVSTGYVWTSCKRKEELNQTSCDTNLSVQIISTDTGKVIAAKRVQESGQALTNDEAKTISRAKACKTVADSLIYQLNSKWDKRTASNYQVTIKGLKDYSRYLKVRDLLTGRQIPGFTNVAERYQSKESLVFEGEKRGSSQTIQDNIITKGFSDGKVRVIKADDTSMEIEVL